MAIAMPNELFGVIPNTQGRIPGFKRAANNTMKLSARRRLGHSRAHRSKSQLGSRVIAKQRAIADVEGSKYSNSLKMRKLGFIAKIRRAMKPEIAHSGNGINTSKTAALRPVW